MENNYLKEVLDKLENTTEAEIKETLDLAIRKVESNGVNYCDTNLEVLRGLLYNPKKDTHKEVVVDIDYSNDTNTVYITIGNKVLSVSSDTWLALTSRLIKVAEEQVK